MQNVKNTISRWLLDGVIPHSCSSCGAVGAILCDGCKNDILSEPFEQCVSCLVPTMRDGMCRDCHLPYKRAWCVGWREDELLRLTDQKFFAARPAIDIQAELLHEVLPEIPADVRVVAVPTIRRHVRQRGFGHAERLARSLASQRGLVYDQCVARIGSTVQHGATKRDRLAQAQASFVCDRIVSPVPYLIVDDIYTTGATVGTIATKLLEAGAREVWIAVVARQPFEKAH